MWGRVVHLKGRNHSEKWHYFVLSSVLSLQWGSNHGLFSPVPTTGPTALHASPTALHASPREPTWQPENGLKAEKSHAWLIWLVSTFSETR